MFQNVDKYFGEGWTDAPIAIIQAGGIRSSIDASHSEGEQDKIIKISL